MKLYLSLILLLPLLGGTVNALAGRKLPRRACEVLACAAVWGAFVCAALAFVAYKAPVTVELATWLEDFDFSAPIALYLDPLSLVMTVMITFVCGLIHLYAVGYMAEEGSPARFFALLNLFVFAMLVLVLAENLPLLYLGWEGVGFCSYALIGFWYDDPKNATAGRKAFITTRIGDTAFGIGIVWCFQLFQTASITQINQMGAVVPVGVITALGLLFLAGAMGKSAQVPLMVWLPDAMAGPTPVSALIHAATMVTAGVYLMARMSPLFSASAVVMAAVAVTGAATAFYGASCALVQRDFKRVLAYSTISQIGYMMLGVGAGAVTAATFHLLEHAFFKALLFLGAGCVIAALHHEQDIFRMGGLRRRMPVTFWAFLAGAACLAGLPPTGGFFSKDAILAAVWAKGGLLYGGLFGVGLAAALLTSFYTFRMVYLVFGGEGVKEVHHTPRIMDTMLLPLAILGLLGGFIHLPAFLADGWLGRFLATALTEGAAHLSHGEEMAVEAIAALVAITGLIAAHLRYGGVRRGARIEAAAAEPKGITAFLLNGWYADALYRLIFIRPYEALAGFLWRRVDEGVIDDSLDRLADGLGRTGQGLGRWSCGRVSVYLLSFAAGLALILGWLAWGWLV
ncbi:NADH-quinone oxidoreductase subunit L [Geobacter benzoatilyticus]|uniref:NADH-quinone oxidoreductase subunit L n=1 Tax=Geobacter benzoatilyticus TaxID=2815309 RepID=A0ABX7Q5J9_9BACT|nr:NADH-quinone oxidoreductase subunit L [Geobacter benzoatilyticus]QSV46649.1 NADH-quinone oxidoreductase subunit L [Geobacter benzoatilyticus]